MMDDVVTERAGDLVLDPAEARAAVQRLADQGASAIKIYYRLPLGTIRAVNEAAHERGLLTTGHLEIVDAGDAVRAGLDGVEHVTSFGTAIVPLREAEVFRQAFLADNDGYSFFKALGDLVVTGPTRTNVNDFRAIVVR